MDFQTTSTSQALRRALYIELQETGCQSGAWTYIVPELPTHLVQELIVGTVLAYVSDQ